MGVYLRKKGGEGVDMKMEVKWMIDEGRTLTLMFGKKNDFVDIGSM